LTAGQPSASAPAPAPALAPRRCSACSACKPRTGLCAAAAAGAVSVRHRRGPSSRHAVAQWGLQLGPPPCAWPAMEGQRINPARKAALLDEFASTIAPRKAALSALLPQLWQQQYGGLLVAQALPRQALTKWPSKHWAGLLPDSCPTPSGDVPGGDGRLEDVSAPPGIHSGAGEGSTPNSPSALSSRHPTDPVRQPTQPSTTNQPTAGPDCGPGVVHAAAVRRAGRHGRRGWRRSG
jgi:hypothetical protein